MKFYAQLLIAAGISLCFLSFAHATPSSLVSEFTVDEAVTLALKNTPQILALSHDIAGAKHALKAAGALANPDISYTPSITGDGSDTEFMVQQPLEINGTRAARTGIAHAELGITQAQSVSTVRQIVFETKSAYFELMRARNNLALYQDLLTTDQNMDQLTRTSVALGSRPGLDALQSGIELVRAQQQVTVGQGAVDRAEDALNTVTGMPESAQIRPLAGTSLSSLPVSDTSAVAGALTQRSSITAAVAAKELERQNVRAIRAEGEPDIAPQYRATRVSGGARDAGFGLAIVLPFIDYGSRREQLKAANERERAADSRIAATRAEVNDEVAQVLSRVQGADAVLADYPHGLLAEAKSLLDGSELGYKDGKTSIIALLEAERTYQTVQSEYIDAQVNAALARADLERATGSFDVTQFKGISQ